MRIPLTRILCVLVMACLVFPGSSDVCQVILDPPDPGRDAGCFTAQAMDVPGTVFPHHRMTRPATVQTDQQAAMQLSAAQTPTLPDWLEEPIAHSKFKEMTGGLSLPDAINASPLARLVQEVAEEINQWNEKTALPVAVRRAETLLPQGTYSKLLGTVLPPFWYVLRESEAVLQAWGEPDVRRILARTLTIIRGGPTAYATALENLLELRQMFTWSNIEQVKSFWRALATGSDDLRDRAQALHELGITTIWIDPHPERPEGSDPHGELLRQARTWFQALRHDPTYADELNTEDLGTLWLYIAIVLENYAKHANGHGRDPRPGAFLARMTQNRDGSHTIEFVILDCGRGFQAPPSMIDESRGLPRLIPKSDTSLNYLFTHSRHTIIEGYPLQIPGARNERWVDGWREPAEPQDGPPQGTLVAFTVHVRRPDNPKQAAKNPHALAAA